MLTQDQFDQALEHWKQGKTLGEIAEALGVGLYDVSPYLMRLARLAGPDVEPGSTAPGFWKEADDDRA